MDLILVIGCVVRAMYYQLRNNYGIYMYMMRGSISTSNKVITGERFLIARNVPCGAWNLR